MMSELRFEFIFLTVKFHWMILRSSYHSKMTFDVDTRRIFNHMCSSIKTDHQFVLGLLVILVLCAEFVFVVFRAIFAVDTSICMVESQIHLLS